MTIENGMADFPHYWTLTTLGQIREKTIKTIDPSKTPEQVYELYSVPVFPRGYPEVVLGKDIGSNKQIVDKDFVLVCKINPRINRVWIVGEYTDYPKIASTEWVSFKKPDGILPTFLCYYMQSSDFRDYLAQNVSGVGGSLMRARISALDDYPFAFPPLPEQERIVERIESLFTQLDAGVAGLKRAQAALKRYKASVLKAACEGRLVPQDPNDEPAEELLKRILAEKEEKIPALNGDLTELPRGWVWATPEILADGSRYALKAGPFGSSLKKEYYVPTGYKIYGQEQVINGDPHYGDYYIDEERYGLLKSNAVKPGDILISLVGTIGKVLILPDEIEPGIINPRLVKLSLNQEAIIGKYFKIYLETETAKHYFDEVSHGETMKILNLGILKQLPIPIPSRSEQKRIVAEVERRLSVVEELEHTISTSMKWAVRLRQAILKRAFEGRLAN